MSVNGGYGAVYQQDKCNTVSQALAGSAEGDSLEREGLVGNEITSSGYVWNNLPAPVNQLSNQSRQLYDSIYSLPLMSSAEKYHPPLNAYEIGHPVLAQGYETTDGLVGDSSLYGAIYKTDPLEETVLIHPADSDFTNRESAERESLPSWENSPQPSVAQLTVDTAVPSTGATASYVSASMGYNEISAYSDITSSTSTFTPCSSLYYSATSLSPLPSPRRQQYMDCVKLDPVLSASRSPNSRGRQMSAYSYDGCGGGWTNGSSTTPPGAIASSFAFNNPQYAKSSSPVQRPQLPPPPTPIKETEKESQSAASPPPTRKPPTAPSSVPAKIKQEARSSPGFVTPSPKAKPAVLKTSSGNKARKCHDIDHFSDLKTPPDLLKPLREEQLRPPPEDMFPSDPAMVPREQEVRFDGDLYTPRWVRGQSNKREGWCGICKPGRWLILKNSAYWYDKSFSHGISATTGEAFAPPKATRRTEGNANIWEGLCGNCDQWIGLVSSKKRGTTWFRHAYKCYNSSNKADGTSKKRRRASSPADEEDSRSCRPRLSLPAVTKASTA